MDDERHDGRDGGVDGSQAPGSVGSTTGAAGRAGTSGGGASIGPVDVKVGGRDQSGKEVLWVYWSTKDYAIYQWRREIQKDGIVSRIVGWLTNRPPMQAEYGISPHFGRDEQRLRYALLHQDLSVIYGLRQGRLACRESVNREIARAIMLSLEGQKEEAQSILTHLKTRMVRMRNIEGRASYLGACMGFMLLALLTLVVASTAGADGWLASSIVPLLGQEMLLLKVVVCGALGAFLSVCISIEKLEIDPETPGKVNRISGITRLVIGMSAALIAYLAIGAGLVLSDGLKPSPGADGTLAAEVTAGILFFAVLAGFSEAFVPNILRRVGGDDGAGISGEGAATQGKT